MKKDAGVSIVELITCLAILGIMAGITYPQFDGWKHKLALRGATSDLFCELHRARSAAIRCNSYAVFLYHGNGYEMFVDNGNDGGVKEDWVRQSGEQLLADIVFEDGIRILMEESTFTNNRMRFSGHPGVKAGTVVMQSPDGRKTKIVVNVVGRVRVEEIAGG